MKKSKYSDSQILAILNQSEAGIPVPKLCREHGMSSATFYKWRAKYGGIHVGKSNLKCIRKCLVRKGEEDRDDPINYDCGTNCLSNKVIDDYHKECFLECEVNPCRYPGIGVNFPNCQKET